MCTSSSRSWIVFVKGDCEKKRTATKFAKTNTIVFLVQRPDLCFAMLAFVSPELAFAQRRLAPQKKAEKKTRQLCRIMCIAGAKVIDSAATGLPRLSPIPETPHATRHNVINDDDSNNYQMGRKKGLVCSCLQAFLHPAGLG